MIYKRATGAPCFARWMEKKIEEKKISIAVHPYLFGMRNDVYSLTFQIEYQQNGLLFQCKKLFMLKAIRIKRQKLRSFEYVSTDYLGRVSPNALYCMETCRNKQTQSTI